MQKQRAKRDRKYGDKAERERERGLGVRDRWLTIGRVGGLDTTFSRLVVSRLVGLLIETI